MSPGQGQASPPSVTSLASREHAPATTFQDAALDHLWRRASLGNLFFFCMPSALWAIDYDEDSPPWARKKLVSPSSRRTERHSELSQRLLRPIRGSDWDRVRLYAPRIRVLFCGSGGWNFSDTFPALSVSLPEHLLQNLRTLTWQDRGADFHYIHLFLRPTLTEIEFVLSSDSNASLLATLAPKCPKLNKVTIHGEGYSSSFLSEFICELQFPEKISVPELNQDALEHLSRLTTLKSLHVSGLPDLSAWSTVPEVPVFPILECLTLSCSRIGTTIRFLGPWRAVPLAKLHISSDASFTAAEAHNFFQVAGTAVSHSTLTTLYLATQWDVEDMEEDLDLSTHLIPHRELCQLQCFTNLTSLIIHSPVGFDLDDGAVEALVPSWPRLKDLQLQACAHTHVPRTTLACLHSFARHCRRLRNLVIALDATTVPILDARSQSHQRALWYLNVDHSPLQPDHNAVADFISAVFPKLKELETHRQYHHNDVDDDDLEEHGDAIRLYWRWKEVEVMLPRVVAIRAEEERRLAAQPST
ncbi:hypothetical protein C8R46DRAFT_1344552 [Mycena filopes]|nr:hypothetical protein C8R46DRAFT_1344552 [Mycena filopes]